MESEEYNLVDAIDAGIHSYMVDAHTAIPGEIVSYDSSTMKAVVKVSINRRVNGESQAIANIPDVPVVFPRSKAGGLTFDIASGDGVLIVFSERNLDKWKTVGSGEPPNDNRMFDLTSAVAIPGLFPLAGLMVPPAQKGTELRGKKFFIGDPLSFTSPIITIGVPANPGTAPTLSTSVPPSQLNLLTLMTSLIDLVSNATYGKGLAAVGGAGPLDPLTISALATLKADLKRMTI
jgi:hypothetical protein